MIESVAELLSALDDVAGDVPVGFSFALHAATEIEQTKIANGRHARARVMSTPLPQPPEESSRHEQGNDGGTEPRGDACDPREPETRAPHRPGEQRQQRRTDPEA